MQRRRATIWTLCIVCLMFVFSSVSWADFVDNENGTVTDTVTGLMWQQGYSGKRSWQEALAYCEGCTEAGYADWRLPNIRELESIVDWTEYEPAIDTVFDCRSFSYWSSSTNADNPNYAWSVGFWHGDVSNVTDKDVDQFDSYVRCVRGGPDGGEFSVTAMAGEGGSISPESQTVAYGQTASFTVTAEIGYTIAEVTGCNGVLSGNTYTTGPVTQDCTVSASFSLKSYTVTFDLDNKGTRTGGGELEQNVTHGGAAQAPTVEADDGWNFEGWDVAFDNVTSDLTVHAVYSAIIYTVQVTASPEVGGSVFGGGTAQHGETITVNATANAGYSFQNWTEDSKEVSTSVEFTFTVFSDRDLVANFEPVKIGSLQVYIEPLEAAEAGAQWRKVGTMTWYDSGEVETDVPVGTYEIEFRPAPGWMPEGTVNVQVHEGETTIITEFYVEQDTSLPGVIMLLLEEYVGKGQP